MRANTVTNGGSHCIAPLVVDTSERRWGTQDDAVGGVLVTQEARELVTDLSLGGCEMRRQAGQDDEKRGVGEKAVTLGE